MTEKPSVNRELLMILLVMFAAWTLNSAITPAIVSKLNFIQGSAWIIRVQMAIQSVIVFLLPSLFLDSYFSYERNRYITGLLSKPSLKVLLYSLFIMVLSVPVVSFISYISGEVLSAISSMDLFVRDREIKVLYDKLLLSQSAIGYAANVFVIGVIPAVCEELFFRGIIQNFLVRNINSKVFAIIISAMIFSIAHFQITEFLSRWVLGFIIGYAYYKSRSIIVPVSMHALNNIIAIILYSSGVDSF